MNKLIGALILILFSTGAFAQKTLTDSHIPTVVLTINEGEIDAGQMAQKNAKSKEVKDFASMMVDEHKKNVKETKDLAKQEKLKLEKSELSESIKNDAKQANKDLKQVDKENFDKAYVASQIAMHEKALNTLTGTLIPQVVNPALKTHLEKTRDSVAGHLAHVKQIQTQLK